MERQRLEPARIPSEISVLTPVRRFIFGQEEKEKLTEKSDPTECLKSLTCSKICDKGDYR